MGSSAGSPVRWRAAGVHASPSAPDTERLWGSIASAASAFFGIMSLAAGGGLAVRRLAAAIEGPLSPAALLVLGAVGTAIVFAADVAARPEGRFFGPIAARTGLVLAMLALALPLPVGSWIGLGLTGTAMLAAAAVVVRPPPWFAGVRRDAPTAPPRPRRSRRQPPPGTDRAVPRGRLRQRLERYQSATGEECLRGRVMIAVSPDARTAHTHVGFCPPFAETPAVTVTTDYDGVEATITAAEVLPWGVRIECRLEEPAEEPFEIPVDVIALTRS